MVRILKKSFSLSWETKTETLLYDFPVFILKLSECNQVDFFSEILAVFANFQSLCITWRVSDSFSDFYLLLIKTL